jgi:hypothetical protein
MLKKVAAALIAVTMSTAPVLAQSAAPVSSATATQLIKAKSAIEQVKTKKHTVKKAKVVRHRSHIKHVRPAKPAKSSHTARISTKPAPMQSRIN